MKSILRSILVLLAIAVLTPAVSSAGGHRIGFGYHYWAPIVSYQYLFSPVTRFEVDLEYFSDGYGGSISKAYAPQVYLLFGRFLYAGLGVGITQSDGFLDGSDWSDPWYALRGGIELLLLPRIHLDINANYRVDAFKALENVDTDSLTLGASLRVSLN
jgi:hypothetical protein